MDKNSKSTLPSTSSSERTEGKEKSKINRDSILKSLESLLQDEQTGRDAPLSAGMLEIVDANMAMERASMCQNPKPLFDPFWYEGEIGCLFADSNVGKSILAMQIAAGIAKEQRVLYFDFELSEKQFQLRYTDENGKLYRFPDKLFRVTINPDLLGSLSVPFEEAVMGSIEKAAISTESKVLVIDNISILCMQTEKGEDAAALVRRLRELRAKHGFSILIIAHTPKRNMYNPITQNDLAGSKKLFNFIDSCFAVGKSVVGSNIRYVKQIKVRNSEERHGTNNVQVYSIDKIGPLLCFVYLENSPESMHLRTADKDELDGEVLRLSSEGKSMREIASMTGKSKSSVHRIIQDAARKGAVPNGQMGHAGQMGQEESFPPSQVSQPSLASRCPDGTGTKGKEETEGEKSALPTTDEQDVEVKIDLEELRDDPLRKKFFSDEEPPF